VSESRTGQRTAGPRVWFAGGGTGGHLYPGLAIARALRELRPDVEPFFIGAKRGIERDILPTTEFAHALLDLHPLYRAKVWNNWKTMRGAVGAWRQHARTGRRRSSVPADMRPDSRSRTPLRIAFRTCFRSRTAIPA
jgi:hypothetical protein